MHKESDMTKTLLNFITVSAVYLIGGATMAQPAPAAPSRGAAAPAGASAALPRALSAGLSGSDSASSPTRARLFQRRSDDRRKRPLDIL